MKISRLLLLNKSSLRMLSLVCVNTMRKSGWRYKTLHFFIFFFSWKLLLGKLSISNWKKGFALIWTSVKEVFTINAFLWICQIIYCKNSHFKCSACLIKFYDHFFLSNHIREFIIFKMQKLLQNIIKSNSDCFLNDTHREKLCFTQFSIRNGWLAASDLFRIFTQSIKFYTFHYHVLKVQMLKKCDSSNGQ